MLFGRSWQHLCLGILSGRACSSTKGKNGFVVDMCNTPVSKSMFNFLWGEGWEVWHLNTNTLRHCPQCWTCLGPLLWPSTNSPLGGLAIRPMTASISCPFSQFQCQ